MVAYNRMVLRGGFPGCALPFAGFPYATAPCVSFEGMRFNVWHGVCQMYLPSIVFKFWVATALSFSSIQLMSSFFRKSWDLPSGNQYVPRRVIASAAMVWAVSYKSVVEVGSSMAGE